MASRDFFIGYTGADQAWAEWIAETLERAGHSTVLQTWDFRPGENFIERMNEALVDAERVVAVLSPAYFRSEYARDEWTTALVRDRGEADRLLPVRVAPAELPPLLANRIYIDLVGVEEPLAAERLIAGVQSGRARPAASGPSLVVGQRLLRLCGSRAGRQQSSASRPGTHISPDGGTCC
jgi:hypothetical protein